MASKNPATIDAMSGEVLHPPPAKRLRLKLDTLGDVRHEMATVYKHARSGQMDVVVATKLVYILCSISKVISDGDIEKRLEALEASQHER